MEKQDILYGAAALVIIIIIALVIKPMMTGEPVSMGFSLTPTPTPVPEETPAPFYTPIPPPATTATPVPTSSTLVPTPTWDRQTRDIAFVDPSSYGISLNQSLPGYTHSFDVQPNTSMVTFATIAGRYSGTTQTFSVPFPYWELWYTAEPSGKTGGQDQVMSTTTLTGPKRSGQPASGSSKTVMEGSYSVTFPVFTIDVMDGSDPNRIVRSITPPGGLDKDLWSGITIESEVVGGESVTIEDPRPWKEKFFEGERNYFFVITTQSLDSYSIEIKVPLRYLDNSTANA